MLSARFPSLFRRVVPLAVLLALAACQTPPVATNPPVQTPAVTPPDTTQPKPAPKPPRIGLALGGGAARGFAHIGVIQVLEENGIHPDLVVGTSAGSLVARTERRSAKWPTPWTKRRLPTGRSPGGR